MPEKSASMERQQFMALQIGYSTSCAVTLTHNRMVGRLSGQP